MVGADETESAYRYDWDTNQDMDQAMGYDRGQDRGQNTDWDTDQETHQNMDQVIDQNLDQDMDQDMDFDMGTDTGKDTDKVIDQEHGFSYELHKRTGDVSLMIHGLGLFTLCWSAGATRIAPTGQDKNWIQA